MYKKSRFNLELNQDIHKFLYNSYTGALAEIESDQFELYAADDFARLENLDTWLNMGYLVPRNLNETKMLRLAFEKCRFRTDLFLTIAPTLLCNCQCDYCFQDKTPVSMPKYIYDAIGELIIGKAGAEQSQIPIGWYGGEPFLCLPEIADFTAELAAQIGCNKLQYSFVTNGTLFDAAALHKISQNADIKSFQVSLDGPQAYHDKLRIYSDGRGTYEDILNNLPRLANYGDIIIRINVDRQNIELMEELLKDLSVRLPVDLEPVIYFANIQRCNTNVKNEAQRYIGNIKFWDSKIKLSRLAAKYQLHTESFPRCSMGCTYSAQHAFVIDPLGDCYKCWDFVGNPKFVIGNVCLFENIYNDAEYLRELCFNPYEKQDCPQCNMLPLCKSGCPAILNGDLPIVQERLSCREIQGIFKKSIKAEIKFYQNKVVEVHHENIS